MSDALFKVNEIFLARAVIRGYAKCVRQNL